MQDNQVISTLKATIYPIIVAFFIVLSISGLSIKFGKEKFLMATDILDMITINDDNNNRELPILQDYIVNSDLSVLKIDGVQETEQETQDAQEAQGASLTGTTKKILTNCPTYGENYASIQIPSIGLDLPINYGKSFDLLKDGVGHDNDSHFFGEGGSIILMGHNYKRLLGSLPKAKVGDNIQITTNYGNFSYTIYDSKIVDETSTNELPIQENEEILMIYTCWPINNIGYTTQRYVVYAK